MSNHISYGADFVSVMGIFVYGCMASMHCIGMCGGIIMSVTLNQTEGEILQWKKQAAYHIGRLLSGLFWGILLGAAGQLLYFNPYFEILFPVVCGMFMIYMGIAHLGVIDRPFLPVIPSLASRLTRKIKNKGALLAGILTGFLPCGMLNTVQVYAAGTGNVARACVCMLAFIAGTIPVLFLFGTFHAAITGAARQVTVRLSGAITILLGLRLILNAAGRIGQ